MIIKLVNYTLIYYYYPNLHLHYDVYVPFYFHFIFFHFHFALRLLSIFLNLFLIKSNITTLLLYYTFFFFMLLCFNGNLLSLLFNIFYHFTNFFSYDKKFWKTLSFHYQSSLTTLRLSQSVFSLFSSFFCISNFSYSEIKFPNLEIT